MILVFIMNKLFVLFFLSNFALAEEMVPYVSPTLEKPSLELFETTKPELEEIPPIKDYEDFLLLLKNNSENFSKIEFYKNVKIKTNNEIKNLDDFDKTKINLFLIYQGEALSDTMLALQSLWENQIEKSNDLKKKQLSKYIIILFEIRKDHAIHFEKEIIRLFSEITDITEQEKLNYINKIKDWNLKNKLTEK